MLQFLTSWYGHSSCTRPQTSVCTITIIQWTHTHIAVHRQRHILGQRRRWEGCPLLPLCVLPHCLQAPQGLWVKQGIPHLYSIS
jgi:hypothetical protein